MNLAYHNSRCLIIIFFGYSPDRYYAIRPHLELGLPVIFLKKIRELKQDVLEIRKTTRKRMQTLLVRSDLNQSGRKPKLNDTDETSVPSRAKEKNTQLPAHVRISKMSVLKRGRF